MKISGRSELSAIVLPKALSSAPDSDLLTTTKRKPPRRKSRPHSFSGAAVRLKRDGGPATRSRPETPLLKWKFQDGAKDAPPEEAEEEELTLPETSRRARAAPQPPVSVRKLAAGLWRLRSPEIAAAGGGSARGLETRDRLGFQPGVGHVGGAFTSHSNCQLHKYQAEELLRSPVTFSSPQNKLASELAPAFQRPDTAMEGATKWDPVKSKASEAVHKFCGQMKLLGQQVSAVSVVSALETELGQAHTRIQELEREQRSSKKKLEHFMRKFNEEKASWRSREHEKVRAVIDDVKADLNRERKNRQRMELVNSKLVSELADAKFSAKRFMQDYEKERRARELIEEVCDELAKEIGEDKSEIEAIKRESMKLREEVEDEKKMLQMAEVWREERVQMKLIDAKVALDEKYTQMSKLVTDMKNFMRSGNAKEETREAESLLQAAASVNIQEVKEFSYVPANLDDIFSVLEDVNFGEGNGMENGTSANHSPDSHGSKIHSADVNLVNKECNQKQSNSYINQKGDIEDDESGWETMSQPEDQGSSFSPDGSDLSFSKHHRNSNVSGSGTDWEENVDGTPITEISEVCSVQTRQSKKSSISRFWKSCPNNGETYKIISVEGMKARLSNGRISNGSTISPDRSSIKSGHSPSDMVGHWSSPDSTNPNINRAKGCIEWPRGMQKASLKAKLLEARIESQKIQLRQVLKQKI